MAHHASMAYVPSPYRPQDAFGNALGNAAIAGIRNSGTTAPQANSSSTAAGTSADDTPMYLRADNSNSTEDQAQAYFNGPFASQTDGMLAGYNPLSGPLLASSDAASTYAGVYGPAGYSLNADQAAVVRSLQGETPWLGSGEWSSNIWQTYIDANGDVNVVGNPVYNASGAPVMENGQQVYDVPGSTVTPSADELAQARGGPQVFTTSNPEGATDMIKSQLGLSKDAIIGADSIMNVASTKGAYMEGVNSDPELNTRALEDRARYEFGGKLAFSVEVKSPALTTVAMVNGTNAVNANMAMMNGTNADAQDYASDHTPMDRAIPENEQFKAVVNGVGAIENFGTEVSEVPTSRLEYRYDVFVSPSDPSNFRVEVTQYNFDYAHGGVMLHYHPFLPQAYALLNGSDK